MDEDGTDVMDTGVEVAFEGTEMLRTGADWGGLMEWMVWLLEQESDNRWLEVPRREVRLWWGASALVEPQESRDSAGFGARVAWIL